MSIRYQHYNHDPNPRPSMLRDEAHIREAMRKLERWCNVLERQGQGRNARVIENAIVQAVDHNNLDYYAALARLKDRIPVTIEEFVKSDEFLGQAIEIWPLLLEELKGMKPDIMAGESAVLEVLNRSCIGTGKSILGSVSILYDIYFLCNFNDPQLLFTGLNKYTPIIFVLQSIRDQITRRVLYEPMRQMFTDIPWVQKNVNWDKDKESILVLDNRIQLVPMLASPTSYIGQATIGAVIDEVNFMEVVQESKKVAGPQGQGGLYDQAEETYRHLSSRRKSRFLTKGPNPGCLYISSSVNYRDDFLDRRIREVRPELDTHIRILDFRQFDVKPHAFSGRTFKFLVGTNDYPPKILDASACEGVDYPAGARIEDVPVEFEEDFRNDPDRAQRDLLGIASTAIHRFISQTHKIVQAVQTGRELGLRPLVEKMNVSLAEDGLPRIIPENLPEDLDTPRFLHIDLSKSNDRCGIAMVKVAGHTALERNGVVEMLPTFVVELACSIQPDPMHHIDIAEIRAWATLLRSYHGLNIKCVSYDGFNSAESIGLWRRAGVQSLEISVDRTTEPYDALKAALYQDRVILPDNDILKTELAQLERIERGGKAKIDHPPKGSKDISDAVAAACRAAAMDRTIRSGSDVTDPSGKSVQSGRKKVNSRRRTDRRR